MSLIVITAPSAEPVTLAEARAQARIDSTIDDPTLARYIMTAREMAEHELQRTLIATTYELTLDEFPAGAIDLPMGPIGAVGAMSITSVKYTDSAGVEQTVSSGEYALDAYSYVPRLIPVSGWPTPKNFANSVRVRYVSGQADASAIPAPIKTWIVLHITALYDNRGAAGSALDPLPFLGRLLDPYRTFR